MATQHLGFLACMIGVAAALILPPGVDRGSCENCVGRTLVLLPRIGLGEAGFKESSKLRLPPLLVNSTLPRVGLALFDSANFDELALQVKLADCCAQLKLATPIGLPRLRLDLGHYQGFDMLNHQSSPHLLGPPTDQPSSDEGGSCASSSSSSWYASLPELAWWSWVDERSYGLQSERQIHQAGSHMAIWYSLPLTTTGGESSRSPFLSSGTLFLLSLRSCSGEGWRLERPFLTIAASACSVPVVASRDLLAESGGALAVLSLLPGHLVLSPDGACPRGFYYALLVVQYRLGVPEMHDKKEWCGPAWVLLLVGELQPFRVSESGMFKDSFSREARHHRRRTSLGQRHLLPRRFWVRFYPDCQKGHVSGRRHVEKVCRVVQHSWLYSQGFEGMEAVDLSVGPSPQGWAEALGYHHWRSQQSSAKVSTRSPLVSSVGMCSKRRSEIGVAKFLEWMGTMDSRILGPSFQVGIEEAPWHQCWAWQLSSTSIKKASSVCIIPPVCKNKSVGADHRSRYGWRLDVTYRSVSPPAGAEKHHYSTGCPIITLGGRQCYSEDFNKNGLAQAVLRLECSSTTLVKSRSVRSASDPNECVSEDCSRSVSTPRPDHIIIRMDSERVIRVPPSTGPTQRWMVGGKRTHSSIYDLLQRYLDDAWMLRSHSDQTLLIQISHFSDQTLATRLGPRWEPSRITPSKDTHLERAQVMFAVIRTSFLWPQWPAVMSTLHPLGLAQCWANRVLLRPELSRIDDPHTVTLCIKTVSPSDDGPSLEKGDNGGPDSRFYGSHQFWIIQALLRLELIKLVPVRVVQPNTVWRAGVLPRPKGATLKPAKAKGGGFNPYGSEGPWRSTLQWLKQVFRIVKGTSQFFQAAVAICTTEPGYQHRIDMQTLNLPQIVAPQPGAAGLDTTDPIWRGKQFLVRWAGVELSQVAATFNHGFATLNHGLVYVSSDKEQAGSDPAHLWCRERGWCGEDVLLDAAAPGRVVVEVRVPESDIDGRASFRRKEGCWEAYPADLVLPVAFDFYAVSYTKRRSAEDRTSLKKEEHIPEREWQRRLQKVDRQKADISFVAAGALTILPREKLPLPTKGTSWAAFQQKVKERNERAAAGQELQASAQSDERWSTGWSSKSAWCQEDKKWPQDPKEHWSTSWSSKSSWSQGDEWRSQDHDEEQSTGRSSGSQAVRVDNEPAVAPGLFGVEMWNFPTAWTEHDVFDDLAEKVQKLATRFGKQAEKAEVVANGVDTGPVVRVIFAHRTDAERAVEKLHGLDNRTQKKKASGLPPTPGRDLFVAKYVGTPFSQTGQQIPGWASAEPALQTPAFRGLTRNATPGGGSDAIRIEVLGFLLYHEADEPALPWDSHAWARRDHYGNCGRKCGCCKANAFTEADLEPCAQCTAGWILTCVNKKTRDLVRLFSLSFSSSRGDARSRISEKASGPTQSAKNSGPLPEIADAGPALNVSPKRTYEGREKKIPTASKLPPAKPARISDEEWKCWQERSDLFVNHGVVSRPDLTFQEFFRERDKCRDRTYTSDAFLLRIGFFCNNDRLLDETTQQIKRSLVGLTRVQQVLALLLARFSGSPREEEKPGKSGAAVVAEHIKQDSPEDFAAYVQEMPFSGRHTYRATLSRHELAIIGPEVATKIAALTEALSLDELTKQLINIIKETGHEHRIDLESMRREQGKNCDNTQRCVAFHALQVAFDLEGFDLISIADSGASCPLATGSRSGLTHVKRWQTPTATIERLARELGVPARLVQTALCEYNKYVKWFSGVDKIRPR